MTHITETDSAESTHFKCFFRTREGVFLSQLYTFSSFPFQFVVNSIFFISYYFFLTTSNFFHAGYSWLDMLHAMCMASNICNSSQNRFNDRYIVGHIIVSGIARSIPTEHGTIAATQRLQFKERC